MTKHAAALTFVYSVIIRSLRADDNLTLDIVGIRPGMAIKDGSEVFYFLVTMEPNPVVISKITWTAKFTMENPPRQDELVATLAKKYGPITRDTTAASLSLGSRELVWAESSGGKHMNGELPLKCRGLTTLFANGPGPGNRKQYSPLNLQITPIIARLRVEEGYAHSREPSADQCADYRMVRARLFQMKAYGVAGPQLVSYMTRMAGDGPLDCRAANATHEFLKNKTKPGSGAGSTPR